VAATTTYIKADLQAVATALAAMTGQPHPLAALPHTDSSRTVEGPLYAQVPAWDDQGPLDRALVTLFDSRDHETTPDGRSALEEEIRAEVRRYVQPR
jgi:hypothetical protein